MISWEAFAVMQLLSYKEYIEMVHIIEEAKMSEADIEKLILEKAKINLAE